MEKKYIYNKNTGALHILGFCHFIGTPQNTNLSSYKSFSTEEDARMYGGPKIYWCKECQKRKEKMLEEVLK